MGILIELIYILEINQRIQDGLGRKQTRCRAPKRRKAKVSQEVRQRIVQSGTETPLEYMLRVMSDPTASDKRRDDMAKAAAPYMHSRLSSIEHAPMQSKSVEELTFDELQAIVRSGTGN